MGKLKKISLILGAAMTLAAQSAFAQVVVVDGYGADKDSAIRDASRAAVEQVVGTLVDSRTLVTNYATELDQIYMKSQGFVKDMKILSQDVMGGSVHVRASVDVDTSPDAKLMNNLKMLMMLNDPRIAVVILEQDDKGNILGHDQVAEAVINARLIDLGFSHVVDAGVASSLQDARLLNRIYQGSSALGSIGRSLGADYLVLGISTAQSQGISLPNGKGGYEPTLLKNGKASMTVKILKFDTGEIIGTFTNSVKAVDNSLESAKQKAIGNAAKDAAAQIEDKFRHFSANANQALQLEVRTMDYQAVQQLADDLRALGVVQNVYIREHQNGKAILSVDTIVKPEVLVKSLQGKTSLGIFVAGISNNTIKMSVSR